MADTKISGLTAGGSAQTGDLLPIDRSGSNFNVTAASIAALASGPAPSLFTGSMLTMTPGTVYQNTTGQPVLIMGWFLYGASPAVIYTDASSTPTTVVFSQSNNSSYGSAFWFIVGVNDYYQIASAGATIYVAAQYKLNAGAVAASGELSGSRALSTVYQNTNAYAMIVEVVLTSASANVQVLSDSTATPAAVVWDNTNAAGSVHTAWFIVPAGDYYEVTCSGAAVQNWNEYVTPFNAVKSVDLAAGSAGYIFGRYVAVTTLLSYFNSSGKDMWISASMSPGGGVNAFSAVGQSAPSPTLGITTGPLSSLMLLAQQNQFYGYFLAGGTAGATHWFEYLLS